jgi:hypothetical protein
MKRALFALLLLAFASPALAQVGRPPVQRPPAQQDTTPAQRALARLRALQGVGQPDSVLTPPDSIRPQEVQVANPRTPATPAPSQMERDSVMDRLLRITGYVGTEYRGDTANFVADSSVLTLMGKAQVTREGYQLVADSSITYDDRVGEACGYGNPVLHAPEMTNPIVSSMVCYDVRLRRGFARGARTQVDQGATWLVSGDMYYVGEDMYSHKAVFTDCDEDDPHYHFAAEHMKVVRGNVIIARNVTMAFRDVKVFWLPFFVQSLSRGRRSGILMPRFGINDIVRNSDRHSRQIEDVGVYWAINDYMGSEVAMDWWANNYIALRGSFDYNFARNFLTGGVTFRRFWKEEGGRDFTIAAQNRWQINERTNVNADVNYATSTQFIKQRTVNPLELNQSIRSNGSFTRRFDWGNLSAGATRQQYISDNTVTLSPTASLTVSPITLFEALPGEERWYSDLQWTGGNFSARGDRRDIGEENINLRTQSRRAYNVSGTTGLQLGVFSFSPRFNFDEEELLERTFPSDTIDALPGATTQRGSWGANAGLQIRLPAFFGNTSVSPSVSLSGDLLRNDKSNNQLVASPTRLNFGASLGTNLYALFPGVGPLQQIRHRVSPSFSYNYSPIADADSLQRAVFTPTGVGENNSLSITLSQTFEGKFRGVGTDTVGAAARADSLQAVPDTAPRRRQQVAPVMLLSISTSALVYDFVRARQDSSALTTTTITNQIASDLIRGLNLTITHDIWEDIESTVPGGRTREFSPHLSQVSTGFSLNSNSWLFRLLRIGSSDSLPTAGPMPMNPDSIQGGPPVDRTRGELGVLGTTRRDAVGTPAGSVGAWNAQFNYTLTRPRQLPGQVPNNFSSQDNSMMRMTFQFQATENWQVNWQTAYSFSTSEFTDHTLQLTRRLHDWDANFNFVKSQNGNFVFNFGVHLRANPDIKVDYSQSDLQGVNQRRF